MPRSLGQNGKGRSEGADLEADEIGDADAEQGCEEDGNDQKDGDEAHERRGTFGEFSDVLDEFCLIGGVFLDGVLERCEVVFEALDCAFLLVGVEGEGAVIGLQAGDRFLKRLEIDFMHLAVGEQIGSSAREVALEQGQHFSDQGKDGFCNAHGAFQF